MNRWFSMASLLLIVLPMVAQAPNKIMVWKSADLMAYAATLAPKVNAQKVASQPLADFGGYNAQVAHREGSGEAEWHDNASDVIVVQSGGCTMILGGTIKDGRTTGAGEIRGASIDAGQSYAVAPGDIINIPPKTPHQMVLPPGGQITYFVVKVVSR